MEINEAWPGSQTATTISGVSAAQSSLSTTHYTLHQYANTTNTNPFKRMEPLFIIYVEV